MYTIESIIENLIDNTNEYLESYEYSLTHEYPRQKRHHNYDYHVVEQIMNEKHHSHPDATSNMDVVENILKHWNNSEYAIYTIAPELSITLEQYKKEIEPITPHSSVYKDGINISSVIYMPKIPDILYFDAKAVGANATLLNYFLFGGEPNDVIRNTNLNKFLKFANEKESKVKK